MPQTREERLAYNRQWFKDNPTYRKDWNTKNPGYYRKFHTAQYGMTPEEYDTFLEQPCAVCGGESECVDHDHKTDKVRGALCKNCNFALGHMEDDPDRLIAAAKYQKSGE